MYDVIIIGSGPAGYTAAIYASRAFLKTILIAGPQYGGQLTTTTTIDNFPGFPKGIMGPTLMVEMKQQAVRFGTEVAMDEITSISKTTPFTVTGAKTYEGKTIIIATGAQAKTLGIASEDAFRGKGISYCATCDGFFFKGKTIAVFGGGDTAMEEATFLTKFAEKVTIIHRREEFRASKIMLEKAQKDPKISFLLNKIVDTFYGDTILKGVKLTDAKTGEKTDMPLEGAFIAIGHTPATAFLKGTVVMDDKGYVQVHGMRTPTDSHTATTIDGIFAAGDCVDSRYRQGIVAAGMGSMAAIDAEKWLEGKK
jgi:thioredoxin reductase (NADPH)